MNLNHFQQKAFSYGTIGALVSTAFVAILIPWQIVYGYITFPLIICLAILFWIITYLGILSIEVLSLVCVLGVNLFLLNRFDNEYSLVFGGIIFKLSFFMMTFVVCILFLKNFFSNVISRNNIINKNKSIPSFKTLFALMGIGLISALFNREDYGKVLDSVYALLYFVIPIFYVYLIPRLSLRRAELIFLVKCFVIMGITLSAIIIVVSFYTYYFMGIFGWESLGSWVSLDFIRISLSFGSANAGAAILSMVLPVCLFSYLCEKRTFGKLLFINASLLLVIGSLITLSRTGILVLGVLLLGCFASSRGFGTGIKKYIILILTVGVIIGMFLNFDLSRYFRTETGRVQQYKTGARIIADNILFGVAPNNVYKRMDLMWRDIRQKGHIGWQKLLEYKSTCYKGHWTFYDPHNVYLMILTEIGLFGFLFFVFILVDIIKTVLHATKNNFISVYEKQILTGMLWGIIGFLLHCLTGSYLVNNYKVAVFFWIYAGTALALSCEGPSRDLPGKFSSRSGKS